MEASNDTSRDQSMPEEVIGRPYLTSGGTWMIADLEEHPDCYFQGNLMRISEDILSKTKKDFSPYLLHLHLSVFQ